MTRKEKNNILSFNGCSYFGNNYLNYNKRNLNILLSIRLIKLVLQTKYFIFKQLKCNNNNFFSLSVVSLLNNLENIKRAQSFWQFLIFTSYCVKDLFNIRLIFFGIPKQYSLFFWNFGLNSYLKKIKLCFLNTKIYKILLLGKHYKFRKKRKLRHNFNRFNQYKKRQITNTVIKKKKKIFNNQLVFQFMTKCNFFLLKNINNNIFYSFSIFNVCFDKYYIYLKNKKNKKKILLILGIIIKYFDYFKSIISVIFFWKTSRLFGKYKILYNIKYNKVNLMLPYMSRNTLLKWLIHYCKLLFFLKKLKKYLKKNNKIIIYNLLPKTSKFIKYIFVKPFFKFSYRFVLTTYKLKKLQKKIFNSHVRLCIFFHRNYRIIFNKNTISFFFPFFLLNYITYLNKTYNFCFLPLIESNIKFKKYNRAFFKHVGNFLKNLLSSELKLRIKRSIKLKLRSKYRRFIWKFSILREKYIIKKRHFYAEINKFNKKYNSNANKKWKRFNKFKNLKRRKTRIIFSRKKGKKKNILMTSRHKKLRNKFLYKKRKKFTYRFFLFRRVMRRWKKGWGVSSFSNYYIWRNFTFKYYYNKYKKFKGYDFLYYINYSKFANDFYKKRKIYNNNWWKKKNMRYYGKSSNFKKLNYRNYNNNSYIQLNNNNNYITGFKNFKYQRYNDVTPFMLFQEYLRRQKYLRWKHSCKYTNQKYIYENKKIFKIYSMVKKYNMNLKLINYNKYDKFQFNIILSKINRDDLNIYNFRDYNLFILRHRLQNFTWRFARPLFKSRKYKYVDNMITYNKKQYNYRKFIKYRKHKNYRYKVLKYKHKKKKNKKVLKYNNKNYKKVFKYNNKKKKKYSPNYPQWFKLSNPLTRFYYSQYYIKYYKKSLYFAYNKYANMRKWKLIPSKIILYNKNKHGIIKKYKKWLRQYLYVYKFGVFFKQFRLTKFLDFCKNFWQKSKWRFKRRKVVKIYNRLNRLKRKLVRTKVRNIYIDILPNLVKFQQSNLYNSNLFIFHLMNLVKWNYMNSRNLFMYKFINFYYTITKQLYQTNKVSWNFSKFFIFIKLCLVKHYNFYLAPKREFKSRSYIITQLLLRKKLIKFLFTKLKKKRNLFYAVHITAKKYFNKKFLKFNKSLLWIRANKLFFSNNLHSLTFIILLNKLFKVSSFCLLKLQICKKIILHTFSNSNNLNNNLQVFNFLYYFRYKQLWFFFLRLKAKWACYSVNNFLYKKNYLFNNFYAIWRLYLLIYLYNNNLGITWSDLVNKDHQLFMVDKTVTLQQNLEIVNMNQVFNSQVNISKFFFSNSIKYLVKFFFQKDLLFYLQLYWFKLFFIKKKKKKFRRFSSRKSKRVRKYWKKRLKYKRRRRRNSRKRGLLESKRYRWRKRKYRKWLYKYKTININCLHLNYYSKKLYRFKMKKNKIMRNTLKNKNKKWILKQLIIVTVNIQFNNTFITITNLLGNVIYKACAGTLGICGPKRSMPGASEDIAEFICNYIKNKQFKFLILRLYGIVHSRKMRSAVKALTTSECKVLRVLNITPKSHNGIRLRKKRRI